MRVRLSSLEPEAITPSFLQALTEKRVCPHFHLSIQSGSDSILHRMKRPYTSQTMQAVIDALRKTTADPFLAADFIVGFPGETDQLYRETLRFIESNQFTDLHLFPFSPRPGTEAYSLKPKVPERVARERLEDLSALARTCQQAYLKRQVGQKREVLLEAKTADGDWEGTSENYLTVHIPKGPAESSLGMNTQGMRSHPVLTKGEVVGCKILYIRDNKLIGSIP